MTLKVNPVEGSATLGTARISGADLRFALTILALLLALGFVDSEVLKAVAVVSLAQVGVVGLLTQGRASTEHATPTEEAPEGPSESGDDEGSEDAA